MKRERNGAQVSSKSKPALDSAVDFERGLSMVMITLPANRKINLSKKLLRGRYEKEPGFHFNRRVNCDSVRELRSDV
jgi:hypothetical protein